MNPLIILNDQPYGTERSYERVPGPLARIYPGFDPDSSVLDHKIRRWTAGIVRYLPGFMTEHKDLLRESSGCVFFNGDYTHNPALDGMVWHPVC